MEGTALELGIGGWSVRITRSRDGEAALRRVMAGEGLRLVSTDPGFRGRLCESYTTYNEAKSVYKQTRWHYMPARLGRGKTLVLRRKGAAGCRLWVLADKHRIRSEIVGMKQAPLAEVVGRCRAGAEQCAAMYNAVQAGDVFDVRLRGGGREMEWKGVIAPTAGALAAQMGRETPFLESEFESLLSLVGKTDLSLVPPV